MGALLRAPLRGADVKGVPHVERSLFFVRIAALDRLSSSETERSGTSKRRYSTREVPSTKCVEALIQCTSKKAFSKKIIVNIRVA